MPNDVHCEISDRYVIVNRLNQTKSIIISITQKIAGVQEKMVVGEGFEPSKASPADLQSAPFDRSGTLPNLDRKDCRRTLNIFLSKYVR